MWIGKNGPTVATQRQDLTLRAVIAAQGAMIWANLIPEVGHQEKCPFVISMDMEDAEIALLIQKIPYTTSRYTMVPKRKKNSRR